MKKRNSAAIMALLAAVLFVFAACSKDGKDKKDETEKSTSTTANSVAYEEITEVVTDASGEAVTDAEGNTTTVTVTRPTVTKPSSNSSSEETTAPEGEKVDVEVDASGVPKDSKLKKLVDEITEKDAIFVDGKMPVDGQNVAVKMYVKGEKLAAELKMGATNVRVIYNKDKVHMLFPTLKMYLTMPPEAVGAMDTEAMMDLLNEMISDEIEYVETTNVKLDGKDHTCEVYKDGVNTNKYYFDSNGNLKRIEVIDSKGNSDVTLFNEFSANVPDSIFSIPSGYKEITEENIESLAGMFGGM